MQTRPIQTQTVTYKDGDVELEGYLALPSGDAPVPGVLVIHEWFGEGKYTRQRAEKVAGLGYAGFSVDMYGKGVRAQDREQAANLMNIYKNDRLLLRKRVKAALDFVRQHPRIDKKRVASIGYCFGGCVVLEMARADMDVAGVVSFHGALDAPAATRAVAGKIKPRVLVFHGADDPFIPFKDVTDFEEEMRQAKADCQLVKYSGVQHSFTNPEADTANLPGLAYNAAADRRSWQAMQNFLEELF